MVKKQNRIRELIQLKLKNVNLNNAVTKSDKKDTKMCLGNSTLVAVRMDDRTEIFRFGNKKKAKTFFNQCKNYGVECAITIDKSKSHPESETK